MLIEYILEEFGPNQNCCITLEVEAKITPAKPGLYGDPGFPPEGEDVQFQEFCVTRFQNGYLDLSREENTELFHAFDNLVEEEFQENHQEYVEKAVLQFRNKG